MGRSSLLFVEARRFFQLSTLSFSNTLIHHKCRLAQVFETSALDRLKKAARPLGRQTTRT